MNKNFKFTYETEINNQIPYLDILILKNEEGNLKFKIYRKPSDNGDLLNYNSYAH